MRLKKYNFLNFTDRFEICYINFLFEEVNERV